MAPLDGLIYAALILVPVMQSKFQRQLISWPGLEGVWICAGALLVANLLSSLGALAWIAWSWAHPDRRLSHLPPQSQPQPQLAMQPTCDVSRRHQKRHPQRLRVERDRHDEAEDRVGDKAAHEPVAEPVGFAATFVYLWRTRPFDLLAVAVLETLCNLCLNVSWMLPSIAFTSHVLLDCSHAPITLIMDSLNHRRIFPYQAVSAALSTAGVLFYLAYLQFEPSSTRDGLAHTGMVILVLVAKFARDISGRFITRLLGYLKTADRTTKMVAHSTTAPATHEINDVCGTILLLMTGLSVPLAMVVLMLLSTSFASPGLDWEGGMYQHVVYQGLPVLIGYGTCYTIYGIVKVSSHSHGFHPASYALITNVRTIARVALDQNSNYWPWQLVVSLMLVCVASAQPSLFPDGPIKA